jgi:hypothetical protein
MANIEENTEYVKAALQQAKKFGLETEVMTNALIALERGDQETVRDALVQSMQYWDVIQDLYGFEMTLQQVAHFIGSVMNVFANEKDKIDPKENYVVSTSPHGKDIIFTGEEIQASIDNYGGWGKIHDTIVPGYISANPEKYVEACKFLITQ